MFTDLLFLIFHSTRIRVGEFQNLKERRSKILKFIFGVIAVIPLYIFVISCSWNLIQVATTDPAHADAAAGQAISNITTDFTNTVIDELNPLNILTNKVLDALDAR
jgi:hypothetical protein